MQQVEGKRSARQKPPRKRFGKKILDHPSVPEPQVPRRRPSVADGGARGLKEQREQQDGGEQGPGASGVPSGSRRRRCSCARAQGKSRPPAAAAPPGRGGCGTPSSSSSGCSPPVLGALLVVGTPRRSSRPGPRPTAAALSLPSSAPKHRRAMFSLTDSQMGRSRPSHAVVEQCRLGHGQHVLDDRAALVGAAAR